MSALGHEQTSRHVHVMSVIPLKADIDQRGGGNQASAGRTMPKVTRRVPDGWQFELYKRPVRPYH
jgi:hypothetical protein